MNSRTVLLALALLAALVITAHGSELATVGAYVEIKDQLCFHLPEDTTASTCELLTKGTQFKIYYIDDDEKCWVEFRRTVLPQSDMSPEDVQKTTNLLKSRRYVIEKGQIHEGTCEFSHGLYAAAITVPLKYRFGRGGTSPELSTELNLGGGIGYSLGIFGLRLTPVAFVGLATISLGDVNSSVETQVGITYGGGFAFSLSKTYQIGLIVGADRLTGAVSREWPFQGEAWLSFGIGYKFLDF